MNDTMRAQARGGHRDVIVIGGGQAGLAMSYCLKARGIEHLVFEKHRVGHDWRTRRWDSFCLVTPNWQCRLPGFPYAGADPHGFMGKEAIVRYIEAYCAAFAPPLVEGAGVTALRRGDAGAFELSTTLGDFTAHQIIVATGGYHIPTIPRMAERLPEALVQLHSSHYRNPQALPEGEVLVVGSGQSGCQIAEDLHLAGRRVHLCVGGAPRTARFYRGRDVVDWLADMGHYDMPVHQHPLKERVRAKANHYVTGRDGGHDIDLRKFALQGMRLYGRLTRVRANIIEFADDLKQNLDQADATAENIKTTIDNYIKAKGISAPTEPRYTPVWEPRNPPCTLDLASSGISTVVWSGGFRTDYRWIEVPVFDGSGYPRHQRGVTAAQGLYFLGLPWLYTWGSGRFCGVGADADYLAEHIEAALDGRPRSRPALNERALGA